MAQAVKPEAVWSSRLGRNIKLWRIHEGLFGKEVAKRSSLTRSHYCDVENGKGNPTLRTVLAISKAMAAPLDLLFFADLSTDLRFVEIAERVKKARAK
jgi:transcriptional regulator with XRE-family HTH domain